MNDTQLLVSGIEYKVRVLIGQVEALRQEVSRIKQENSDLQMVRVKQLEEIKQLEERIKILNVAKRIESGKDSAQAKLKINELVREIDHCIGLLNKES